jgi:hypothetical protein
MKNIDNDFLTGFEVLFYWFDENKNLFIFNEDKTGIKEDENKNVFQFRWKINENGILAIIYQESKIVYYWKFEQENENGKYKIQTFEKKENDKKPQKTEFFSITQNSQEGIESELKTNNIEKIKDILNDYNQWNYIVIGSSFAISVLIILFALNHIVIVKDFTLFFQLILVLIAEIFLFRPLLFMFNKLSYKVRYWVEEDSEEEGKNIKNNKEKKD